MCPTRRLGQAAARVSGMMTRLNKTSPGPQATAPHALRLRAMILRCAACPGRDACAALQALSVTCPAAPAFCPNRRAFQALPDRS
ncbi:DUF6455 family protein [Tateyamaria sp. SN6-1]|uniref:DUF6455 family protein n=1 Tax=Tateyamaria sp. SN6-1 TaxID=3092148 RepID=UPI0039F576B0